MSTEDSPRIHHRHIDCMDQHEEAEEMNFSPLQMLVGSHSELTCNHGGGGMVQGPIGGVL